jgi:VanZ like protein
VSGQLGPLPGPPRRRLPDDWWHGWVRLYSGEVRFIVIGLLVAVLVVLALAHRRRRAGSSVSRAWRTATADVGLVFGTLPGLWITTRPGDRLGIVGGVSLVPGRDLITMGTVQIVGNLLILAALGFFAPLRFSSLKSLPRILLLAAGGSAMIETAQFVFRLDRVSSIDDVLLNTAGAGLAALASRRWWQGRLAEPEGVSDPHQYDVARSSTMDGPIHSTSR